VGVVIRPLALHQITAMEAGPVELVSIAAATGCQGVCIFTHSPRSPLPGMTTSFAFPVVDQGNRDAMLERLADTGITVGNIEFFPIQEGLDLQVYRDGLALGGELGAQRAVTHIHDPDDARAVDTLGRLCDMAAGYGITLGLEFMGLTPACNSVQRAAWFVGQVGRNNIGIGVDALHLARTGGTPAEVAELPAHLFVYAQICDGAGLSVTSDYLSEAENRKMPGDGDFPLRELIEALPLSTALDVEVPSTTLVARGVSALDRAREAVARARVLTDAAKVSR